MTKKWEKTQEGTYSFFIDNQEVGKIEIDAASLDRKAICSVGGNRFLIKRTGFWKRTIEIGNDAGETIATLYHEKWYASSWILEYNGKKYTVLLRNNPLAEYVIRDNCVDIAAYGLASDHGRLDVRITTSSKTTDVMFDFLLWYLFLPIVTENMNEDVTFLLLLSAQ